MGAIIYSVNKQISDIQEICSMHPKGASVEHFKELDQKYSVQYMGPSKVKEDPETMQALFCATLTMCDTSCTIEFQGGKVTNAYVSNL